MQPLFVSTEVPAHLADITGLANGAILVPFRAVHESSCTW